MSKKIKVLIVDDSAVMRGLLSSILSSDKDIEVVGTAIDPYAARQQLIALKPDVMTLDVEMPRMDGITFLKKVMTHVPTPTIIISSLTQKNSETSLRAMEVGAVNVVAKPVTNVASDLAKIAPQLIAEVKTAARANIQALRALTVRNKVRSSSAVTTALAKTTHQVIAIASSTGGTEALRALLSSLPPNIPGVLIVQHMPPGFTTAFATRLNELMPFEVREACDGDRVIPGRVLIAPGNYHMELARSGAFYYVSLNQGPQENSVRPAADVLMRSVAKWAGKNAIGAILTGMGRDGALGIKAMHDAGARTIAQDEASSVVFGMPKAAIELGCIDYVLPLHEIGPQLIKMASESSAA